MIWGLSVPMNLPHQYLGQPLKVRSHPTSFLPATNQSPGAWTLKELPRKRSARNKTYKPFGLVQYFAPCTVSWGIWFHIISVSCQGSSAKMVAGTKPAESVMLRQRGNSQAATQRCSSKSKESHEYTLSQQLKILSESWQQDTSLCKIILNYTYKTLPYFQFQSVDVCYTFWKEISFLPRKYISPKQFWFSLILFQIHR